MDRETKAKTLKAKYKAKLKKDLKKIAPRDFISFEVLRSHLPVFICNDRITGKQLEDLADEIALELLNAYRRK